MDADIVIGGAGPAGLALAKELSRDFKVVVIDKKPIPLTTCKWYTYKDRIQMGDLEGTVVLSTDKMIFRTTNEECLIKDEYVVLDSQKVLEVWKEKTKARFVHDEIVDVINIKDKVTVLTKKHTFNAKLYVDCTGIFSPVLRKFDLVKSVTSWEIYGYVLHSIDFKSEIVFEPFFHKKRFEYYWGIYPHSSRKADVYLFRMIRDKPGNFIDSKGFVGNAIKERFPDAKRSEVICGQISSGELKKYALDRILFYGESGMFNPPAIGMGFNEIVRTHKQLAQKLKPLVKVDTLSEKKLQATSFSIRNMDVFLFQNVINKFFYSFIGSPKQWDDGLVWLNSLGGENKYWMRNELSMHWMRRAIPRLITIVPWREVAKNMTRSDYVYVVKSFARYVPVNLIKALNIFGRSHG